MSTPEIPGFKTTKNKYSPFCNGINKSLLTPCRQIGLSRKRRIGSFSKHSSEDLNLNNTSISSTNSYSENENGSTPVTHPKLFSRRKRSENLLSAFNTSTLISSSNSQQFHNKMKSEDSGLRDYCDLKKSRRDLLQTFTSEDLFNSNDDISSSLERNECIGIVEEIVEDIPHCMKMDTEFVSTEEFLREINNDKEQKTLEGKNKKKLKKTSIRGLTNDFIDIKNNHLQNDKSINQAARSKIGSDSDDDFVISKGSQNSQRNIKDTESKPLSKPTKKTLSQRKSLEGNNLSETNYVKNCKIQLQKLSKNDIKCVANDRVDENMCIKTSSRKCSSNGILDDADFFTSTPEEEKSKKINLQKKMKVLEREIKQKQSIFENLQRASIYKSKHNIQDLKQLTTIWSEGCAQGLKDLLTQLQAHSSIDMGTLLNNMNIPKEIVAKLQSN